MVDDKESEGPNSKSAFCLSHICILFLLKTKGNDPFQMQLWMVNVMFGNL